MFWLPGTDSGLYTNMFVGNHDDAHTMLTVCHRIYIDHDEDVLTFFHVCVRLWVATNVCKNRHLSCLEKSNPLPEFPAESTATSFVSSSHMLRRVCYSESERREDCCGGLIRLTSLGIGLSC